MKKLLNFLLVRRSETENEWWHRLANVFIFGSSIVFLLFISAIMFFKFEYKVTSRETIDYDALTKQARAISSIHPPTADDFRALATKYGVTLRPPQGQTGMTLDQFQHLPPPPKGQQGFTLDEINSKSDLNKASDFGASFSSSNLQLTEPQRNQLDVIVHQMILNGEPDSTIQLAVNDFKEKYGAQNIKRSMTVQFGILFKNILIVFFLTFVWFIFWESLVYKTILYIIYGRQK